MLTIASLMTTFLLWWHYLALIGTVWVMVQKRPFSGNTPDSAQFNKQNEPEHPVPSLAHREAVTVALCQTSATGAHAALDVGCVIANQC